MDKKVKIAVLVSGGGTNLQALIDAEKSGIITSGKIVCVTSQADFIAINKHVGYTMSKAALVGMIKVCALEWAEYGINVNGVAPTVVNTYMGEKAWQGKVKTDMIERIPAHRFAETDEIAAAVLFLSSDESNMITGEDLVVDGGFTIY